MACWKLADKAQSGDRLHSEALAVGIAFASFGLQTVAREEWSAYFWRRPLGFQSRKVMFANWVQSMK
jgi:hypothetical protein